jgi:DNA-binding NtrC family response regulator
LGLLIGALLRRHLGAGAGELRLEREAARALYRHPWPQNVREHEQALASAAALASEGRIGLAHLPAEVRGSGDELLMPHVSRTLADVERAHIDRTLRAHRANRTRAARELGISRATLIKKIREYELGERPSAASRRENGGGP